MKNAVTAAKKRVLNRFTELMKNAVTAAKKRVLNRFTELMKNAVTAATCSKPAAAGGRARGP
jgi:hypothetical protein